MDQGEVLRIVRASMEARLVLRILYRSGDGKATRRDIEVRDLQRGHCRAWCHLRHDMRTFRLDRIVEATMLRDAFMPDGVWNRVGDGWLAEAEGSPGV